jgi:hypothetical protein
MRKICLRDRSFLLSHQKETPDDDLDAVVPIRPAQAPAVIQTLKDWEE